MKNSLIICVLATTVLAGTLFAACQSAFQKEEAEAAELSAPQYTSAMAEAHTQVNQNTENEEWKSFRTEADARIRSNEMLLAELSVQLNKPGTALDTLYAKRIRTLSKQNQAFKPRLEAFEKNRNDWETFKRDFNHDMDELEKALKSLSAINKN
jgi:outer membrane PBP1 activator LpoA protein